MTNKIKKKILIVSNYIHFWQTAEFYEVLKHKFDCKIIIPKNSKFILDHIDDEVVISSPFKHLMYLQLLFIHKSYYKVFIVDGPEYPDYPSSVKGWAIYLHQMLMFLIISLFLKDKIVTFVREVSRYFPNLAKKGKIFIFIRNKILFLSKNFLCENKTLTKIFKNNIKSKLLDEVKVSTLYTRTSKSNIDNSYKKDKNKKLFVLGVLGAIDQNRKDYSLLLKFLKKNDVNVKIIFLGKSYGNSSKEIINKFNQIDKDILMYKEQIYISEANFIKLGKECDLLVSLNIINETNLSYGKYKGSGSFGDAILLNKHLICPSSSDIQKEFKSFSSYYNNYLEFENILLELIEKKTNPDFTNFSSNKVFSIIEKELSI